MDHQQSDIKIYITKDYDRFRMINGNRALNQRKIDRILKDIKGGNNMLRYKPIEVRQYENFLEILDGQHRMFVSKKLGQPVHYIIVEENKSMAEIATINSNVDKWKYDDYINCYINQGNDHYVKLQEFLNLYGISIGTTLKMLSKKGIVQVGGTDPELLEKFFKGLFKIVYWDESVEIAERAKLFSSFKSWNSRYFIDAINRIHKAKLVELEVVLEAFKRNPDKMLNQSSTKQYIYNLEQIVNIGKQKRIVIA